MAENFNEQQVKRLQAKLNTLDPTSKEYGIVLNRIGEIQKQIRMDKESELKVEQAKAEIERRGKETEHKINLEKEEFDHKKELDILEFEHKKEVDSLEYELKSDETERTIRLKERELEAKEKEDKDKFKHDLAHEGVKGGIKFALLAGAYVLEAKGVVLPGRLLQFINGLGK